MPKEQINRPKPHEVISASKAGDEYTETRETHTDPAVWVAWDRDRETDAGHVQLTVSCGYGYVKDLVAAEWGSDVLVSSGGLSRSEVNKLIATLRRARDQAYGKDE